MKVSWSSPPSRQVIHRGIFRVMTRSLYIFKGFKAFKRLLRNFFKSIILKAYALKKVFLKKINIYSYNPKNLYYIICDKIGFVRN